MLICSCSFSSSTFMLVPPLPKGALLVEIFQLCRWQRKMKEGKSLLCLSLATVCSMPLCITHCICLEKARATSPNEMHVVLFSACKHTCQPPSIFPGDSCFSLPLNSFLPQPQFDCISPDLWFVSGTVQRVACCTAAPRPPQSVRDTLREWRGERIFQHISYVPERRIPITYRKF